jgi:hypothetical protein
MSDLNTNTPIEPDPVVTTRIATSFTVVCTSLTLFTTASFALYLLDDKKALISSSVLNLTTQQYLEWNNNDEYIVNLAAIQLGVTPLPPNTPPVLNI